MTIMNADTKHKVYFIGDLSEKNDSSPANPSWPCRSNITSLDLYLNRITLIIHVEVNGTVWVASSMIAKKVLRMILDGLYLIGTLSQ